MRNIADMLSDYDFSKLVENNINSENDIDDYNELINFEKDDLAEAVNRVISQPNNWQIIVFSFYTNFREKNPVGNPLQYKKTTA